MSYMSGEPVPPGFEDEISRSAIIQKQIVGFSSDSLIGTEYVVEVHEDGQARPDYFCVLCNTCNDRHSIFTHWTSMTHRSNYLKTHFQKAFEVLQQFRRNPNSSNDLQQNITAKVIQVIEKHFGRSTEVLSVGGVDFRRFRAKICSQVRDKFHFDECAGPDFVDVVRQFTREPKTNEGNSSNDRNAEPTALDPISSEDDGDGDDANFIVVQPQQQQALAKKARKKQQQEQQPAYRAVNRSPPLNDKNNKGGSMGPSGGAGVKQTLPTPKELSLQASHIAQERYKWEKFRCLLELQLKQLRDETETYESNPEKHPDYSEEWKQFWNRRYKQLQEEKKVDPNNYDYKPEWISYWKDRRVELFNISVNKIKKDLKEKFKLTDEDEENTKELMERYKIRVTSPRNPANTTAGGPNAAGRRKANYRGNNNRSNNGGASDAVIDISDDEQQAPSVPNSRLNRRPAYGRSMSGSLSPKRGRPPQSRAARRSRSRSPLSSKRRGRSRSRLRSRSRSVHRRSRSPYSRARDQSHDYGERERDRGRERGNGDYYRERDRGDSYSRSSRNREPMETFRVMDSRVYPEYSQPGKRSTSPTGTATTSTGAKDAELADEPDGSLTVVSVLRMLSALEDHLGSLGPKTLNLLSKALAMEKIKPNAADDLLLNEDNCVFMETTKEKLKGILIAEVLDDPQKVRVVKKLICNIASIIFQVTSKGAQNAAKNEAKHGELNRKEYQLPYDRQIASSKLANALVMNGLDDMSTDDMNRLLHFYTMLVKTNHTRRQSDRSSGLSFAETRLRLGLSPGGGAEGVAAVISGANDLDIDLGELMKEVEHQLAEEAAETLSNTKSNITDTSNGMESLTDSDLQTLLQNFKFLSNEEQVHLIGHLRKLEVLEPPRVERLRKYVNIAELSSDGESCSDYLTRVVAIVRPSTHERNERGTATSSGSAARLSATVATAVRRKSPERDGIATPAKLQRRGMAGNSPSFMIDDDDDDDYNFDDLVMKATDPNSKKTNLLSALSSSGVPIVPVQSSPNALTFKPAASKISLKDTENIIANLMGTLANSQSANAAKAQQQQQQQHMRNMPNVMQQQRQQQQQLGTNNNNSGYIYYGNEQMSNMQQQQQQPPQQQQQQPPSNPQQQQQSPYQMSNYNAFGPAMGGGGGGGGYGGGGGGVQLNPWANGPSQQYNNMPQNFMQQQQQQQQQPQHYNNMFGGH